MHERMVRACAQARICESNRSCRQSLLKGAEVKRGVNPGGRLFRVLVHLVFFDFAGQRVSTPNREVLPHLDAYPPSIEAQFR